MSTVSQWANKCKDGGAGTSDLWDNSGPGHPVTATSSPLKEQVERLINDDCRNTQETNCWHNWHYTRACSLKKISGVDIMDLMKKLKFFLDSFTKLVHHWQKYVQLSGDYVEK